LEPGLYLLDVQRALEQLIGGRLLGRCKVCGLEFRFPPKNREWPTYARSFITHPLAHDTSDETRLSVKAALDAIDNLTPEWAEETLVGEFERHAVELAASGVLVKVQGEQ
jgi:hypothetical protein